MSAWQSDEETGSSVEVDDDDDSDVEMNGVSDPHDRQQLRSRPSRGRPQPDIADDDDDEF